MNKSALIEAVAAGTGVAQATVKTVLNAALENIVDTVKEGDEVQLSGFGVFSRSERAARSGMNQFTNKPFNNPAYHAPKFTPAKAFKESVR